MASPNLSRFGKVTRVMNAVAAGTSDQNSSVIDMQGYNSVTFYALFGSITATAATSVKAQQGAQSDMSDAADLQGTAITVADDDDDQVVVLEIEQPRERYIRCVVDRGTANAVIDGIIALQTKAITEPVTHDATTVVRSQYHLAPDEGTA